MENLNFATFLVFCPDFANGNPCVHSYDVNVRVKARRHSLILMDWIGFTKEAIQLDFNTARIPTTFS